MKLVKVSVCILAYNHGEYISQAIESVLAQKVDFDIEILIGEDASHDETPEIIAKYAAAHPELIHAEFHGNQGKAIINGRKTGRKNFCKTLQRAKGEYVIILDGDDYWLDENKLSQQVSFLDENPDYVAHFHNAICVDETGNWLAKLAVDIPASKQQYDQRDILQGNPVPTMSCLFRNPLFTEVPEIFWHTDMADWPLHIINAKRGNFYYLPRVLSAYRVHEKSVWHEFRQNRTKALLSQIDVWLKLKQAKIVAESSVNTLIATGINNLLKEGCRNADFDRCSKAISFGRELGIYGAIKTIWLRTKCKLRC